MNTLLFYYKLNINQILSLLGKIIFWNFLLSTICFILPPVTALDSLQDLQFSSKLNGVPVSRWCCRGQRTTITGSVVAPELLSHGYNLTENWNRCSLSLKTKRQHPKIKISLKMVSKILEWKRKENGGLGRWMEGWCVSYNTFHF